MCHESQLLRSSFCILLAIPCHAKPRRASPCRTSPRHNSCYRLESRCTFLEKCCRFLKNTAVFPFLGIFAEAVDLFAVRQPVPYLPLFAAGRSRFFVLDRSEIRFGWRCSFPARA